MDARKLTIESLTQRNETNDVLILITVKLQKMVVYEMQNQNILTALWWLVVVHVTAPPCTVSGHLKADDADATAF